MRCPLSCSAACLRLVQTAAAVAQALHQQAESCPPDVAGRMLLRSLAELAGGPQPPDPGAVRDALRSSLRLIPGGRPGE